MRYERDDFRNLTWPINWLMTLTVCHKIITLHIIYLLPCYKRSMSKLIRKLSCSYAWETCFIYLSIQILAVCVLLPDFYTCISPSNVLISILISSLPFLFLSFSNFLELILCEVPSLPSDQVLVGTGVARHRLVPKLYELFLHGSYEAIEDLLLGLDGLNSGPMLWVQAIATNSLTILKSQALVGISLRGDLLHRGIHA